MEINDPNIRSMERRGFLTLSAGLIGAIVFGSIPDLDRAGEMRFAEGRCGGGTDMGKSRSQPHGLLQLSFSLSP